MKVYNPELKFSAVKIKKIIQGNKDIGKIAHMTPYVISKSLEFLVQDLLEKAVNISKKNGSSKLQSSNIKKIIMNTPEYQFLIPAVKDFPDEPIKKPRGSNKKVEIKISEEEDGIITFHQKRDNKLYHYIYLKDSFSFDMSLKNKIYSWKIKFLSTSNLIGVGLSYKDIVLKNNNKFFDENNNNFINGTFSLIQTYNPIIKNYCIRPWNCFDKNLVNHVAEFPSFKKGKEILIKYNTNKDRIEFIIKKHVYFMEDIKLNRINNINLMDLGNNKRIIGKGFYNLNEILTSADTNYQEISISQIGNGSMSLGTLNIALTLENDSNNINIINDEGDKLKLNKNSPLNKFKKGLSNTTSDLYKNHNKIFNK